MLHALTVVQWLLLAVAVQQSIFAVAWLSISRYAGSAQQSARYWAVFCGVGAASILLLGLRGSIPDVLGYQLADVLLVASAIAARHANALFFGRPTQWLEQGLILALAIVGVGLTGTSPHLEAWRVALVCLLIAWIAVRGVWIVHASMAQEFGSTISLTLHIPALMVAAALLWRAVAALNGDMQALHYRSATLLNELLSLMLLPVASFLSLAYGGMLMARQGRRLRDLALKDTLTGLYNRRAAQELLEREWTAYRQKDLPFCVLMIDIDHFKHINDAYGHAVGDKVLIELAARLRSGTRPSDHVARMGGEEFLVFLPQTEIPSAHAAAERLRQHVAAWTLEPEQLSVTVSIGVAQAAAEDEAFDDLLIRADRALYAAKSAGRNRVHLAETVENEVTSLSTA
ncbi:MAG: GGDEF domain-containing protein [Thiomonas sp.]|nr:GGDEF domain-containing protein [Thiomonas sp.]